MGSGCSKDSKKPEKAKKKKDKTFLTKSMEEHDGGINGMCLSQGGSMIITVSEDKTARLWDTKAEECIGTLKDHKGYITSVCASEKYAYTCSSDKTIRKWNIETASLCKTLEGHKSNVHRLILSGKLLFSSSYDTTVRCWNSETGKTLKVFRGHKRAVHPILLVPSETSRGTDNTDIENSDDLLISGSSDNTAKAWEMNSNDCLITFKGHEGPILCLACDNKGKTLFTGSSDCTVRSWDLMTGAPVKVFQGHAGSVLCIQVKTSMYI